MGLQKHSDTLSVSLWYLMWPSLSEIPLFHVLNAKITFGSVNKCSTEEEANTSAAATPTSTGDDEAAGWKADGLSTMFKHKLNDCHFKLLICWFLSTLPSTTSFPGVSLGV